MKDWRGTEMHVGSTVVYGTGGNTPIMREGIIEKLTSEVHSIMMMDPRDLNEDGSMRIQPLDGRKYYPYKKQPYTYWKAGIRPIDMSSRGPRGPWPKGSKPRLSWPTIQNVTVVFPREQR